MAYDLAPSLKAFRSEVNARWPQRDKTSDGWIGDAAHSGRISDHNPGARDLVHAFDTDEDLDGQTGDTGADAWPIVAQIIANRDQRVKYLIYEGRIIAGDLGPSPWQWRPYGGVNAHRHHVHLSILSTPEAEQDTSPWLAPKQGGGPIPKPDPSEEDDDMLPFLHISPWTGVHVVDASGATWVSAEDLPGLSGLRVFDTSKTTERFSRAYIAERGAGTDEALLASEKAQELYLAAVHQIELREEQRDLAAG